MSVDAASNYFINREFSLAVAELGPLPFKPQAKPWILYFALCDRAFAEADKPTWPLNGTERKALRSAVIKGLFWEPIMLAWNSNLANVSVAVITAAMSVTAKHRADPVPAVQFVESYLADIEDEHAARSVATAFIIHILVELQHDYFYAQQLISGELFTKDESQKARLVALISEHEAKYLLRQKEETELLVQQEKERVAAAIAETQRQIANTTESQTTPISEPSTGMSVERGNRRTHVTRPQRSLSQVWKAWFSEFIRSQGFYNFLGLFFLICSLASSSGLRRQAARFRVWLWAIIMQSLKMGLTVTYL